MTHALRTLTILAVAAAAVLLVNWGNGTYRSEFGRYPDEGMHYITGLLIGDFLAAGSWDIWRHPMQFALDYYSHFPKVALGNWPPVFEILQALWGFLFGVSRASMLTEMAGFTALLAWVVYNQAAARCTPLFAAAAALALIAAPLTQIQTSMVMAEVPLAFFSLLAIFAWVRYLESGGRAQGFLFGFCTMVAIMTKGNGWVIPLVISASIPVLWRWSVLRKASFWTGVAITAGVCIPYTLFTMGIVVQGWNQTSLPGVGFLLASLQVHHRFVAELLGWPLYVLVLVGLVDRIVVPLVRSDPMETFWAVLGLYGFGIILFHATIPTSIEPRKIYQIAPVLCIFLAAGLAALARWLGRVTQPRLAYATTLVCAAGGFLASGFYWVEPFAPGFAPVVQAVINDPLSRGTAVLVSSNPTYNDAEAAILAEWACRQRDAGTFIVRGNKLLSRNVVIGDSLDFEPYDHSPQELAQRLAAVPISYVIVHTTTADHPYQHHALLRAAVDAEQADWEMVYHARSSALGNPQEIQAYRYRHDVRNQPVHLEIDLSRKLGIPAVAGADPRQ